MVSPGELHTWQELKEVNFSKVKMQHLPELTTADTGKSPCSVSFPVFQLHFKAPKALENTPGQLQALVSSGSVHTDLHLKHVRPYMDLPVCQLQCSQKS